MPSIEVPGPPGESRVSVNWHVSDETFVALALRFGKSEADVQVFRTEDGASSNFRSFRTEVDGVEVTVFGNPTLTKTLVVAVFNEIPAPAAPAAVAA